MTNELSPPGSIASFQIPTERPQTATHTNYRPSNRGNQMNTVPPSPATDEILETEAPPSAFRCFWSNLYLRSQRLVVILTYPLMVLCTIITLILVLTLCFFPTIIMLVFGVCLYYCCMDDPIPLALLLRYILTPENEDLSQVFTNPPLHERPVIGSKLIMRRLVEIRPMNDKDDDDGQENNEYPRKHPHPVKIYTNHTCLHFSEPLVMEEEEEKETEEDKKQLDDSVDVRYADVDVQFTLDTSEDDDDDDEEAAVRLPAELDDTDGEIGVDKDSQEEGAVRMTTTAVDLESPPPSPETEQSGIPGEPQQDAPQGPTDFFGWDSISSVRDRGTACDICLLNYEVGDVVAWSPNMDCTHAYHKDCLLDWLIRKPTCPNCRHNYLKGAGDEV